MVQRSPRLAGLDRGRWRLDDLGRVVPGLRGRSRGSIARLVHRLGVRYKRGRAAVHSPDLAYDQKLGAITAAQAFARADPNHVVLLDQDEFTYRRRPTVSRAWAWTGGPAPRAEQGWGTNKLRRVAATLDAATGRVVSAQRHRFDRGTLIRFYRVVEAAYPAAQVIYLVQENWPVHAHPDVLAALAGSPIQLLFLPTSAPWTNPVEDLWRGLLRDVLHQQALVDDWEGLQAAVARWLGQWATAAPALLRQVGLCPD